MNTRTQLIKPTRSCYQIDPYLRPKPTQAPPTQAQEAPTKHSCAKATYKSSDNSLLLLNIAISLGTLIILLIVGL